MSASGFYLMSRGWMEHPALAGREPFSRREAWVWMIEQAHWQPRGVSIGGKTVDIARGQFCHSYRFMAKAWGWEIGRVQRFIGRLVTDGMIGVSVEHGQTLLTLCNYDKYQGHQRIGDTPTDTPSIHGRYATDTNKKQGKQGKEEDDVAGRARTVATAAATEADPCETIVDRFLELRDELWPSDPRLPAPTLTLKSQAKQYLDHGAPPLLVIEVMERRMRSAANEGRSPTNSFKAFHDSIRDAIISHKPQEISHGKSIEASTGRGESVLAAAMRRRGIEAGSPVGRDPGGDVDALLPAVSGRG